MAEAKYFDTFYVVGDGLYFGDAAAILDRMAAMSMMDDEDSLIVVCQANGYRLEAYDRFTVPGQDDEFRDWMSKRVPHRLLNATR